MRIKYLYWPQTHNIGIQRSRKELKKYFYDDFNLKKTFGLHGSYRHISALYGYRVTKHCIELWQGIDKRIIRYIIFQISDFLLSSESAESDVDQHALISSPDFYRLAVSCDRGIQMCSKFKVGLLSSDFLGLDLENPFRCRNHKWGDQSISQPASQSVSQPPSQPASQLASQSVSQPDNQLASQSGSRPISQPASQPPSQPASESASQPIR